MAYIEKYGIKFHPDFWFLLPGFNAITLFGHVFCKMTMGELRNYLITAAGKRLANHEGIHIAQVKSIKTGYVGFYALYLMYWFRNLFVCPLKAYRNIPFEKEAYANQYDYNYLIDHPTSCWRDYKDWRK